jgi:hypothetical protein
VDGRGDEGKVEVLIPSGVCRGVVVVWYEGSPPAFYGIRSLHWPIQPGLSYLSDLIKFAPHKSLACLSTALPGIKNPHFNLIYVSAHHPTSILCQG